MPGVHPYEGIVQLPGAGPACSEVDEHERRVHHGAAQHGEHGPELAGSDAHAQEPAHPIAAVQAHLLRERPSVAEVEQQKHGDRARDMPEQETSGDLRHFGAAADA